MSDFPLSETLSLTLLWLEGLVAHPGVLVYDLLRILRPSNLQPHRVDA